MSTSGCIQAREVWSSEDLDSRFRSGTLQRVLTTQVLRWKCSSTRASYAPWTLPSVTVRLYSLWKTTKTSGQDVSEYLDTLGLVKSFFPSFWRKKF